MYSAPNKYRRLQNIWSNTASLLALLGTVQIIRSPVVLQLLLVHVQQSPELICWKINSGQDGLVRGRIRMVMVTIVGGGIVGRGSALFVRVSWRADGKLAELEAIYFVCSNV